jgi:hypothetical protein
MAKLHRVTLPVVGLLIAVLVSSEASAQVVRVPGTSTSLEPPKGFSLADRFPGFQSAELQASIMVTEIPGPAPEVMKGMTKDGLAKNQMNLISSKAQTVAGQEGMLLHVSQTAAGTEFLKWILVAGDQKSCVTIVGTFPKSAGEKVGEAIRKSMLTASRTSGSMSNPLEGLSYRVTPTPKMKLAGRLGNMLMLTESGSMGPHGPDEPAYFVGPSVGDLRIDSLQAFSETRAKQTARLKDIKNFEGRALKVDGRAAYELLADAKDDKSGAAIRLYQVVAPEPGGYLIAQGLIVSARAPEMLPEFRRITASYRRTGNRGQ